MTVDYSKKINELVEYLNTCRDEYYNNNRSLISDKEYDDLFDKLKLLEDESGIILSNSPTQSVGYQTVEGLEKVEHDRPMLSLDKTKSYRDVIKFCDDKDTIFMHKMDGLTLCITYDNGSLKRIETRGDGITGEDITHNAKSILGVPQTIKHDGIVHVYGEAIITQKDFEYLNAKLPEDEKYATARNLASGSVRQYDSTICRNRKVRFICWNANDLSKDGTMTSGLDEADKCGFITVFRRERMSLPNMVDKELEKMFNNMRLRADKASYPIDGIVIMFNNIEYGESLGRTGHHFRNGLAFKFYDDTYETKLRDIEYTIGKTGVLTPVAVFDPVNIDGTSVTRASLANRSILKQTLKTPFIGQTIFVSKRNQVIPKVESCDEDQEFIQENEIKYPRQCPYCGEKTSIYHNYTGVENLICKNIKCKGVLLKKLSAFVSKQAMDIDGLSEKTLEKFIELGWITTYSDIYNLKDHSLELSRLDGFGDKSVSALLESIENSKNTTLSKLFIALNIDNIGKQNAVELEKAFCCDPQKVLNTDTNIYNILNNINGFGEVMVDSVVKWLHNEEEMQEYQKLISILNFKKKEEVKTTTLNNLKFVITGSLKTYKNRDELVSTIESNGGKVQSSVSKETSYLINNDVTSNSGKNKKAKELNIPIISEEDFNRMLGSDNNKVEIKPVKKGLF